MCSLLLHFILLYSFWFFKLLKFCSTLSFSLSSSNTNLIGLNLKGFLAPKRLIDLGLRLPTQISFKNLLTKVWSLLTESVSSSGLPCIMMFLDLFFLSFSSTKSSFFEERIIDLSSAAQLECASSLLIVATDA